MNPLEGQAAAIKQVLGKERKLTGADLQILRTNTAAVSHITGKSDYFVFRMEIELIDAIRSLDESSAELIKKTNWLTGVILALTGVGILLAAVQIVIAARSSH
jgi:hypothetical protein